MCAFLMLPIHFKQTEVEGGIKPQSLINYFLIYWIKKGGRSHPKSEAEIYIFNTQVNVCREKGSLLSFAYKFSEVARQCC
jgi:hypothetical protein